METIVGGKPKGSASKTILSNKKRQTQSKFDITSNSKAMISGHGKTSAYLHRFKLLEIATRLCNMGDQTTDQLQYVWKLLNERRENM